MVCLFAPFVVISQCNCDNFCTVTQGNEIMPGAVGSDFRIPSCLGLEGPRGLSVPIAHDDIAFVPPLIGAEPALAADDD